MKLSRDWLTDFVDWIETDPTVIADRLTRCVGEVDEVIQQGVFTDRCVVGKVLTLEKHPNADKLSVCTVQTDEGIKHVVCGGTNVKPDMLVAFAHAGATVKVHGKETLTLEVVKIRGELSEGMICAAEELALEHLFAPASADGDRPIMDLGRCNTQNSLSRPAFVLTSAGEQGSVEQAQLRAGMPLRQAPRAGMPLRQALGLTDVIFCIDNHAITNRPDLFSHVGVARELVALGLARWKKQPKQSVPKFPTTPPPFNIQNDVKNLVPYYAGCVLSVEGAGSSPEWMQRRLRATGWRPINLIADITNYVLMEIGMPLHAFDVADFRGDLHIRASKKGERITTLDRTERVLPEGAVVISDDSGIFDLFGIMGGLRTSINDTTRQIFVHAGIIDPVSVRHTVIALGHRTDAATVYEKGVLPVAADAGLRRAIELFTRLSPKTEVVARPVTWGKAQPQKVVRFPVKRVSAFIGATMTASTIRRILTDLGCRVKTSTAGVLSVSPPVWRRDLSHAQDIIEEVARIYGYENIGPQMPEASIKPPARETKLHRLRETLSQRGATELVSLAFTSPQQCQKWNLDVHDAVSIENPIGEEVSLMRLSLVPELVETAARELKHTHGSHLKMYEVGRTFSKKGERNKLALTVVARGKTTLKETPLLIAKADLEWALRSAGYEATIRKVKEPLQNDTHHLNITMCGTENRSLGEGGPAHRSSRRSEGGPIAHAGRSAEVLCQNTVIGCLFELHPALLTSLGLPERTAVGALDLDALLALPPKVMVAESLPLYPAVFFDESVPPPQERTYAELKATLQAIDPLLKTIEIVNFYEKDATKVVTMRFTYRSPDRTLTQEEVEKIHGKVLEELKKK